jgi:hypothetical protein
MTDGYEGEKIKLTKEHLLLANIHFGPKHPVLT